MLSWRYLCRNKYEVIVLVEYRNSAAGAAATAAPHASHGRGEAPHGAEERLYIQVENAPLKAGGSLYIMPPAREKVR